MAFYQREKVNPLGLVPPAAAPDPVLHLALLPAALATEFKADIADNPGFLAIDNLAEKVTDPVLLGVLIVLYVGTQLAASAVTAISADPMQRRIMFALPFVFVIFIVNFEAGPDRLLDHDERLDDRAAAAGAGSCIRSRISPAAAATPTAVTAASRRAASRRAPTPAAGGARPATAAVRSRREGRKAPRRNGGLREGAAAVAAQEEEALGAPALSSEELVAEAQGETLGEAKWAAMKELETPLPGPDRGLRALRRGRGRRRRRSGARARRGRRGGLAGRRGDDPGGARRARARRSWGGSCTRSGCTRPWTSTRATDEIRATVNGDELGLLIGKHGATIDALQHLAFRAAFRGEDDAQAGVGRRGRLPRAARGRAAPDGGPRRGRGAPATAGPWSSSRCARPSARSCTPI